MGFLAVDLVCFGGSAAGWGCGFALSFLRFLRIFSILSPAFFTITFETFSAPFSATFFPTFFAKFVSGFFKTFPILKSESVTTPVPLCL